jgi:hypothetical protein
VTAREKELWIPAARLLAVVEDATIGDHHPQARALREVRAGRRAFVSLRVADGILCELNLDHFWHIPASDGGLADIYEDGAQYGSPLMLENLRPGSVARRYASPVERLEARRRSWRESKQRAAERRQAA